MKGGTPLFGHPLECLSENSWRVATDVLHDLPSEIWTAPCCESLSQQNPAPQLPATPRYSHCGNADECLMEEKSSHPFSIWHRWYKTKQRCSCTYLSSVYMCVCVCVCAPLRKQCQAVGGQEKLQAMSSSSEREDLVDTAEPHSLLVCGNRKEKHCQHRTASEPKRTMCLNLKR